MALALPKDILWPTDIKHGLVAFSDTFKANPNKDLSSGCNNSILSPGRISFSAICFFKESLYLNLVGVESLLSFCELLFQGRV